MRGKHEHELDLVFPFRITPADAGKTRKEKTAAFEKQDHPRGCGENLAPIRKKAARMGSPPRMRGKLPVSSFRTVTDGITPADAGKTQAKTAFSCRAKDHPRGCGENAACSGRPRDLLGSPPRMRGKLLIAALPFQKFRITPADAGKTSEGYERHSRL